MELSQDQTYIVDEKATFWGILPGDTWVLFDKKSALEEKFRKTGLSCHATMH